MSDIRLQKKDLRKEIMKKINVLPSSYREEADNAIRSHLLLLPEYQHARTVFCFVGTDTEIDTSPFLRRVLSDGKILAVPLCISKGIMEARRIRRLEELTRGYYGLLEPAPDTPLVEPEQIDLAVIPCVSCSHTGARLGHGGGFYDIYFSLHPSIPTVMICRERIITETIPVEAHDLHFSTVVTENGVFRN